jgi:urease accessory protein
MRVNMTVTGYRHLHWLPQETILFDGAGFARQLDVQMVEGASFLGSEMMVFGPYGNAGNCASGQCKG